MHQGGFRTKTNVASSGEWFERVGDGGLSPGTPENEVTDVVEVSCGHVLGG